MRELSLHILDIITNAIEAGATRVILLIEESALHDRLRIVIRDNGRGMPPELIRQVTDPFTTSRTTRQVGMGLPLWAQAAERCGGGLDILSQEGCGTTVDAVFRLHHLNRVPLGDIAGTMINLIIGAQDVHFYYRHHTDRGCFGFDSYWFYARMAESGESLYALAPKATTVIGERLRRIDSRA